MKSFTLLLLFVMLASASFSEVTKTVNNTAGSLATKLTAEELKSITNLTIQGTMDARDFKVIRDQMPALTYLDMKSAAVLKYSGYGGTLYYNPTGGYPENTIPPEAFSNKVKIKTIILPQGINAIQNYAFQYCSRLHDLELPSTVEKLGSFIFNACDSLSTINLPPTLKEIGDNVFYNWRGLKHISLPNSITSIGTSAFTSCINLQSIEIPGSVRSINRNAFSHCSKLTSVSLPVSLNTISDQTFLYCFQLQSIIIPDSVKTIGTMAFYQCFSIDKFHIPAMVNSIGRQAFTETRGDISVDTGNLFFSSLGGVLFDKKKEKLIHCPASKKGIYDVPFNVNTIGEYAFSTCDSLTEVRLPSSLKSIHERAFYKCKGLASMNLPLSVTSIGRSAFDGCAGIQSIIIPDSVQNIAMQTFFGCSGLKTVHLPAGLKSLGVQAFGMCIALRAPVLPESLRAIHSQAFYNCKSFDTLMVPASVDTIGSYAFNSCTGLKSLSVRRKLPVDLYNSDYVFSGIDKKVCKLFVPYGSRKDYADEYQWNEFQQILEMPGFKLSANIVYLYGSVDSYASVTIKANVPWTATVDQLWVKVIPDRGSDSTSILVIAERYGVQSSRIATITVSSTGLASETITVVQQPLIASVRKTDVLGCYGAANGMISFYDIVGTDQFEFSIDGGESWKADTLFSELYAGTYLARIRELNDTTVSFSLGTIVLKEPRELRAWVDGLFTIYCGSYHPGVNVYQPRGGSGLYEYSFDGGVTWRTEPNYWEVWGPQWMVVMMREAKFPDCAVVLAEGEIMYSEPIYVDAVITEIDLSRNQLGSINLTAYGNGQYEYLWSTGETTEDIEGLTGGYYYVEIMDQYNYGCIEMYSFYLNMPPNADAGSDQIVTSGARISLDGSGSSDPDKNPLTYHWTGPDGLFINNPDSPNPFLSSPDVDKLTVLRFSLVVNDGKTDSYPSEVLVIVCPAYHTVETINICEGESYQGYTVTGTYTRILKSVSGCDSTVVTNLLVIPGYTFDLAEHGDTLLASGTYRQYQWFDEAGPIAGATDSIFVINRSGKYYLEVEDDYGCIHTSAIYSVVYTDVPTIRQNPFEYALYPNPTTHEFIFELKSPVYEDFELMLVNPMGQCIETRKLPHAISGSTSIFNVAHLSKGVYLLKINQGMHHVVEKIVVR